MVHQYNSTALQLRVINKRHVQYYEIVITSVPHASCEILLLVFFYS